MLRNLSGLIFWDLKRKIGAWLPASLLLILHSQAPPVMTTSPWQLTKRGAGELLNLSKRLNSLKLLFRATADSLFTISLQPITRPSATPNIILSKMVK